MRKTCLILIISLLISFSMTGQNDTKIIYVGDPMCSWCYGLTDELKAVLDHFEEKADIAFVMGGLRPYYDVPMAQMKEFLAGHWKQVNKATGQEFTYGILDRNDLNYDTEPSCRAVVVYRTLGGKDVAKFFKDIQRAFYYYNHDPNDVTTYLPLLENSRINIKEFESAFHSDEMKQLVKKDFENANSLGVNSFPTILVEQNGKTKIVARGYASSEKIISSINQVIN